MSSSGILVPQDIAKQLEDEIEKLQKCRELVRKCCVCQEEVCADSSRFCFECEKLHNKIVSPKAHDWDKERTVMKGLA